MKVKEFFTITIFGFISAWFGILAIPIILVVSCNIIDYITGIMAAHNRGQSINSKTSLNGIFKKVGEWLLILIGYIIDIAISSGSYFIGWKPPVTALIATLVCLWLVFNEVISILENISDIGTNVPKFLITLANKLKTDIQNSGDKIQ